MPRSEGAPGPPAQSAGLVSRTIQRSESLSRAQISLQSRWSGLPMLFITHLGAPTAAAPAALGPWVLPKSGFSHHSPHKGPSLQAPPPALDSVVQLQSPAQEHKSLFSKSRFFHGLWSLFGISTSPASPWGSDHRQVN